jgi:HEAT repeat protein
MAGRALTFLLLLASRAIGQSNNSLYLAPKWEVAGITASLNDPVRETRLEAVKKLSAFLIVEPQGGIEPVVFLYNRLGRRATVNGISDTRVNEFLADSNVRTVAYAIGALGTLRAKNRAPDLIKLFENAELTFEGDELRESAAKALIAMGATEQIPELSKLLANSNRNIRIETIDVLSALNARQEIPALAAMLQDRDFGIRISTINALSNLQASDRIPLIVAALHDPDLDVRRAAAEGLGTMGARDYIPELATLLNDQNVYVRASAAHALGRLRATTQIPALVRLLENRRLPHGNYVEYAADLEFAASALAAMKAPVVVPELIRLLRYPDEQVRLSAAKALGAVHAVGQVSQLVKLLQNDPSYNVRWWAALSIGDFRMKDSIPALTRALLDKAEDVRAAAAVALGEIQATVAIPELLKTENDEREIVQPAVAFAIGTMQAKDEVPILVDWLSRANTVVGRKVIEGALGLMGPLERRVVPRIAEIYYSNSSRQAEIRFLCYYLTGGDAETQLVVRRTMLNPGEQPGKLSSLEDVRATLRAFHDVMPAKRVNSRFNDDADKQILRIVADWKGQLSSTGDVALLQSLQEQMGENSATALEAMIKVPWWRAAIDKLWKIVAIQIGCWIVLLYFYPSSAKVQAFFFWNRWARTFLGLGYVEFLLTWTPLLRERLLAPFRQELIAEARVRDEGLEEYFEDVEVLEADTGTVARLGDAIPQVLGQMILEGESGLGKSIFLRRLVKYARQSIVYLPATSCDQGLLEAIQIRLQGKAGDDTFLKSIIWSGGLRIIIDGLNEVTIETREKIRRFMDEFPKAHILLATQPMLWKHPPLARVFRLRKLSDGRILRFLESRYPTFHAPIPMTEAEYQSTCQTYIADVLGEGQPEEDRSAARLTLSNPMDLSTAAEILMGGAIPTLKNLQAQQYARMKTEFEGTHPSQEFPLQRLSESVYERRLRDELALDSDQFLDVLGVMAAHKMVLERNEKDAAGKPLRRWFFRHDKIRDYFLLQAMLNRQEERIAKHIDDLRFRGVYLMLGAELPLEQARELRDSLVERASETRDYFLSDAVVQLLKTRKASSRLYTTVSRS